MRVKTAATLARRVFIGQNGWFGFHKFLANYIIFGRIHILEKFSASAIALRIAMDLLTVS